MGYSLGGLLARYMIGHVQGRLMSTTSHLTSFFSVLHSRNFFADITPINFATIATPHVGLITRGSFRLKVTASLGPYLLSRTGEHFYGVDKWGDTGRPLLEVMSDEGEYVLVKLMCFFSHYI